MLETMRRSSRSLLIYLLFGIVIAVFIVNFGPQSHGGCESKEMAASHAAEVDGTTLSLNDYRFAYLLFGGGQAPAQLARRGQLKERVMDRLIERELLAQEAERMGFRVSAEEVEDLLMESKIVGGGFEQTVPSFQKDGAFDYELFRRFVQYQIGTTPKAFIESQRREVLANRARQVLVESVTAAPDAVKEEFLRKGNLVDVEYVRFANRRAEAAVEIDEAELKTWAAANDAKVKERFEQRKFLYEKAPKQRKLRQIFVKSTPPPAKEAKPTDAAKPVDEAAKAAADKAAADKAKAVADKAKAAAKKKADDLAARVRKGEAFAVVAKAASDDAATKLKGGLLGWKGQGSTTLGPALEDKVFQAKDGEIVGPLEGPDGFFIVVAEGTREGALSYDQVKLDLAEDLLREQKAKDKAKAEADAALAKAKADKSKTLKDLFPAPADDKGTADGAPRAEETGLIARSGARVGGIGESAELANAVWNLTTEQPFAGPYEVGGGWVIAKLKERKKADLAELEKKKGELMREAAAERAQAIVSAWLVRRCQETAAANKISVNQDVLRYEEGPQEAAVKYEPCVKRTSLPF